MIKIKLSLKKKNPRSSEVFFILMRSDDNFHPGITLMYIRN